MGDCNSTKQDERDETYQDNEEVGKIIDEQIETASKINCRYQYWYDSGDYGLLKCRHKNHPHYYYLCIGKKCKKKKSIIMGKNKKDVKNCLFHSLDSNYSKNHKRHHKCGVHGVYVPCELYYGEIKKCKEWRDKNDKNLLK